MHRITGVTKDSASGQSVASYAYGTGADLGKLMTMTEGGSTTTLAYADAAHAHAVTGRSGGAMTAPDTYTYDGDGNIASRYGGEVYAYDAENRLSAVSTYPTRTDYWYDGLGNMNCRWTVTPGMSGAANVRDRYIDGLYEEKSTSGQAPVVTKNYYASGRIIAQRKTTASGSTVTYLLADHLGSTVGTLTDGGAAQHVQYYPYGNVRSGSVATDKMFTGQQREGYSRIGAYFYKGRFYATGLGHFLSADSSTADGLDRYAYVRFNPLRYNDPTGHDPNDGLLWNPVTGQPTASPTPGCDDACGLRGVQAGCALRPDSFFCPGYPGRGGGSGSGQCDAHCLEIIAGLLQCAANYDACTHGGVPTPTSTPAPTAPVATPLCGVGAGTCSAPSSRGGGGCGPFGHVCHDIRHAVTGCAHGKLNDCLTVPQLIDLLPITETCAGVGAVVGGPAGGLAAGGLCAPVSGTTNELATIASLVQIAISGCSMNEMKVAVNYSVLNAEMDFPGSFAAEAAAYEGQQRVLDC
ncbi:MAG: RHS repeat-associated core domain-containing protein [Chloroflexi bacterium]|nr:RHS repeat-associated core domain-containing protein [Chloroflexota bacterium]